MRRAISIALCLLMVLSLFTIIPVNVSAIERTLTATGVISGGNCGANGDNVTWSYDSGTGILTISGSGDMADYEYDSNPAPWNSYGITVVIIEDGVTSIGLHAFRYCTSLAEVSIPDSVVEIGRAAFSECSSLTSIVLPASLESISNGLFDRCSNLTQIEIPASLKSIGYSAFSMCSSLESIELPDSLESIGDDAFIECTSLSSIRIPNKINSIGSMVFDLCSSLTEVTIPASVTSIGFWAFHDCTSLTHISVPDSVTSIGNEAFGYDSYGAKIAGFTIYGYTGSIAETYANENGFTFVDLSSHSDFLYDVNNNEACITGYTGNETELNIPSKLGGFSVTRIGGYAFYGCSSIERITIPESVTSIGENTFSGCTSLKSINIPDSVTSIGLFPFQNCSLESVTLSQYGVDHFREVFIRRGAYTSNTIVKTIILSDSVTSIGNEAFRDCKSLENITIPDTVESIGTGAFAGCSSLKKVAIPSHVTTIGEVTFSTCTSLEEVVIPDSVTSIGHGAFVGCTKLNNVVIPATEIGDTAFYGCTGLLSVDIRDTVVTIGYHAFYDCPNLKSVTIPDSVTSIGTNAFGFFDDGDDALGKVEGFTIYGYTGSKAETYTMYYNHEFITFVPLPAVGGHSLSLNGDIGANFYMQLTEKEITEGAVVDFSWMVDGKEKTESVTLTAADKTANGYKATCHVAPAEMTSEITATLTVGGVAAVTDTYSVQSYAQTILTDNDFRTKYIAAEGQAKYDSLIELVQAMLDYGARAQIKFNRDIEHPANEGSYTFTDPVDPDGITATMSDMNTDLSSYGLEYTGSTVVLLTKTSIRHYYKIKRNDLFNAVKNNITFNGKKVGYTVKGDEIYFELKNISAPDLNMPYTLHIGTTNYQYAVLDYIKNYLTNGTNNDTKALISAMYYYHQKAKAYFG